MCTRYWFVLKTPTSDPYNPTSYSRITYLGPTLCNVPGPVICAIYACSGNIYPLADQFTSGANIYSYIINASPSPHIPQPTSGKVFVYTKPLTWWISPFEFWQHHNSLTPYLRTCNAYSNAVFSVKETAIQSVGLVQGYYHDKYIVYLLGGSPQKDFQLLWINSRKCFWPTFIQ